MRIVLLMCLLGRLAALSLISHGSSRLTLTSSLRHRSNRNRGVAPQIRHPSMHGSIRPSPESMNNDPPQSSSEDAEWMMGPTGEPGSLERLCSVSLRACQLMNPLISAIYEQLQQQLVVSTTTTTSSGSYNNAVKKEKQDDSAFTIADGLVQRLLIEVLFSRVNFRDIVGEEEEEDRDDGGAREEEEEEGRGTSNEGWFQVQGLTIPTDLRPLVVSARDEIESLAAEYLSTNANDKSYQHLTIFIDPIDGTREFSTGRGEQCSVCIGFANKNGKSVGGVVYRPLSWPNPTWVAGVKSEQYAAFDFGSRKEKPKPRSSGGLLTTNGSISPFIESLIEELQFERIKSGGAGNKMMMLLENSISRDDGNGSMLYIQDRGVSRWDTCAAEACLEAFGGSLMKLTHFDLKDEEDVQFYTYLASGSNLDFVPGSANLTKYNCRTSTTELHLNQKVFDVGEVKPYSNLCGLVALGKEWNTADKRMQIRDAIKRAATRNSPSYD